MIPDSARLPTLALAVACSLALALPGCTTDPSSSRSSASPSSPPSPDAACDDPQLAARLAAEASDPSQIDADAAPRFLTPDQFACVLDAPRVVESFSGLTAFEVRLKSVRRVEPEDDPGEAYRAWLATQAMPFTEKEQRHLRRAAEEAGEQIARLYPELGPIRWNLVKASGFVEGATVHSHQAAIVLPAQAVDHVVEGKRRDDDPVPVGVELLLREAFHVLSRMRGERVIDPVVRRIVGAREVTSVAIDPARGERLVRSAAATGYWALPSVCPDAGEWLVPLLIVRETDPRRVGLLNRTPAAVCVPEASLDAPLNVGPKMELLSQPDLAELGRDAPFGATFRSGSIEHGLARLFTRSILLHAYGDGAAKGFEAEEHRAVLEAWGYAGLPPHPVSGTATGS